MRKTCEYFACFLFLCIYRPANVTQEMLRDARL